MPLRALNKKNRAEDVAAAVAAAATSVQTTAVVFYFSRAPKTGFIRCFCTARQ